MKFIFNTGFLVFEDVTGDYTLDLSEFEASFTFGYEIDKMSESQYWPAFADQYTVIEIEGAEVRLINTPINILLDGDADDLLGCTFTQNEIEIKPEDEARVYEFLAPFIDLFAVSEKE